MLQVNITTFCDKSKKKTAKTAIKRNLLIMNGLRPPEQRQAGVDYNYHHLSMLRVNITILFDTPKKSHKKTAT